ncbi:MAG: TlpA family protein disulfide reductase [Actinomycetia bacterium]|nr:TlpA family protein disulfide reductase [Actinomycetes bacterium]
MSQTRSKQSSADRKAQRAAEAKKKVRTRQIAWIGAGVLGFLLLAGFLVSRPAPEDAATVEGQASLGASAPAVEMVGFDGETVALSDYAGTPVVLNFWASWCPFCVAEMPDFEDSSNAHADEVAFIGVNLQDDAGAADSLAVDTGVTYQLTRDPQGVVYSAFGGIGMPTTVFIDANGVVAEVVTGQLSRDALEAKINQHFEVGA